MPTHWFTADTHFGHENIIPFCGRPFRQAGHMDSVLIENMWKVVQPDDDLWIIGDFAFRSKAKEEGYLDLLFGQLPGARKHLIVGNHDHAPTLALPWDSISHLAEVQVAPGGLRHTLCHYPMITWNGARKGSLHLFGHVHNNWQGSRNAVNVGVDVWDYMPVTLRDIERRARTLPPNAHWADVEHRAELP